MGLVNLFIKNLFAAQQENTFLFTIILRIENYGKPNNNKVCNKQCNETTMLNGSANVQRETHEDDKAFPCHKMCAMPKFNMNMITSYNGRNRRNIDLD